MPPDCEKDCDFQPRTISFCPWIMSLAVFLTNSILLDMLISFLWNKCWIFFFSLQNAGIVVFTDAYIHEEEEESEC